MKRYADACKESPGLEDVNSIGVSFCQGQQVRVAPSNDRPFLFQRHGLCVHDEIDWERRQGLCVLYRDIVKCMQKRNDFQGFYREVAERMQESAHNQLSGEGTMAQRVNCGLFLDSRVDSPRPAQPLRSLSQEAPNVEQSIIVKLEAMWYLKDFGMCVHTCDHRQDGGNIVHPRFRFLPSTLCTRIQVSLECVVHGPPLKL